MTKSRLNSKLHLAIAAVAAFSTYFCMYAFRKPFTAATYEDYSGFELGALTIAGGPLIVLGFKTMLVVSQLTGYMLSKVIGIKVISEMQTRNRAGTIIALVVLAELALVGFSYLPLSWKPLMLFLNGQKNQLLNQQAAQAAQAQQASQKRTSTPVIRTTTRSS